RPLTGLLSQDPHVEGTRRARWDLVEGAPRWTFDRPSGGWDDPIRVRYRLAITAERPLNAWSAGLDEGLLYAPAEALFLVPTMPDLAARHAAIRVRWNLPRGWDAFTGWEGNAFYGTRTLVKTNILAGEIVQRSVDACGLTVELGVHGQWSFAPVDLAGELAALACAARHRLGVPAVDRFAVSLVPARFPMTSGNRNGPHAIGFVHQVSDGDPPGTRLLAHELVHLWQQFDGPAWFQEGVNDYMALRLAHEAGLLDEEMLAGQLEAIDSIYREHPQHADWSFADEAREALPYGPSDAYLAYRKGALVGLSLDRELRLRTGGRADVALLWRAMNARAGWGHVQWTNEEIAARASALAEGSVSRFFDRYVHGTAELPPPADLLANLPALPEPRPEPNVLGAVAAFLQATFDQ
ncbi:MAG TPA: hypothetical protein VM737_05705, partial [Gemmatimonadota bacterium]|nr:hypothetical protein [Gemmatimonadota bacterium]